MMHRFAHVLYPALQKLQRHLFRRDYLREERLQERLRQKSCHDLRSYSFSQAVAYANRMAQKSEGFRIHLNAAGIDFPIPEDRDVWARIPMMTKKQIKANPEAWYTVPADSPDLIWTSTSGSTGQPFQCPIDPSSMTAEIIANELNLKAVGWNPSYKEAVLKVRLKPLKGLRRLSRTIMGNVPLSFASRELNPGNAPAVIDELRRAHVQFMRGYPSTMLLLAEEMLKKGLEYSIPLIEVFGGQLTPAGADIIEQAFKGKVYRDYGASEAQHIAFECREQDGYHIDLTRYYLEVMNGSRPAEPGETGEIVVTAFRNDAMPLIRYCIGDLATIKEDSDLCSCGSHFPRLGEVLGRISQVTYTSSGQQIGEFFFHSFVMVLNNAQEHFVRYKVLQKGKDTYEVLWVPRHDRAKEYLTEIEKKILHKAQIPLEIIWREVEDIPPDPSGKRGVFTPLS